LWSWRWQSCRRATSAARSSSHGIAGCVRQGISERFIEFIPAHDSVDDSSQPIIAADCTAESLRKLFDFRILRRIGVF
jgi:hypothetical protein